LAPSCDVRYYRPADRVLAVAVRDQLPRRRASSFAVVLLALLGVALILAGFRVDVPMLSGGSPATWHGGVHGIAFLLIIATGVLAPLTMALAMRGDAGWRPITVMSLAAVRCSLSSCSSRGATPHSWWRSSLSSPGSQRLPYAWRRIPPKPRCAFVADEGGALTAAAFDKPEV